MVNEKILNYIRENKEKGFSEEQIREELEKAGWKMEGIKEAFDELSEEGSLTKEKTGMRDALWSALKKIREQPKILAVSILFVVLLYLAMALLVIGALFITIGAIAGMLGEGGMGLLTTGIFYLVLLLLANAVFTYLYSGFLKIALKVMREEDFRITDMFVGFPVFIKMFFGFIFYYLALGLPILVIVLLGFAGAAIFGEILALLFTIIVAITAVFVSLYLMIKFFFFDFFIVDKGSGALEALKKSFQITRHLRKFAFFVVLVAAALALSVIEIPFAFWGTGGEAMGGLIVGIVSTPVMLLYSAFVYEKIVSGKSRESKVKKKALFTILLAVLALAGIAGSIYLESDREINHEWGVERDRSWIFHLPASIRNALE